MVLSRFWYLLLSVTVALAFASVVLVVRHHDAQLSDALNESLGRDRLEIEAMLKLDARARIDAIAPLSADAQLRQLLREASSANANAPTANPAKFAQVSQRLVTLNSQLAEMRADMLLAIDRGGNIVGQVGGVAPNGVSSLSEFPLVKRALEGFVRDDVWIYNSQVYRMAARPVIDSGQYVGALVHGMVIDQRLTARLSERIGGATVAFFRRDRVIASHMPSEAHGTLSTALEARMGEALQDSRVREGGRTDALLLSDRSRAVYSLITGSASHDGVGYAIARPIAEIGSPFAVFERTSTQDVQSLNLPALIALAIGLFGVAMFLVWVEHDRTLNRLRDSSKLVADGKADRMDASLFGGRYRKVATNVNAGLEKAGAKGPSRRRTSDLDELLGSGAPSGEVVAGAFTFGGPSLGSAGGPTSGSSPGTQASPPSDPPTMISQKHLMAVQPAPSAKKQPPPPPPRAPAPPATAPSRAEPQSGVGMGGNSSSVSIEEEDQPTMIAQVPGDLLQRAAGVDDADERHFREVYEQFVALKSQCNEPTTGMSYERFLVTLKKNREQILRKHGAKTVRFAVYVKDSKAALKATPVRE